MFEKVNPSHPDKICDRIGGAIVDLGYKMQDSPKIAGECLLGHGNCHIIIETSVNFKREDIEDIVHRIAGFNVKVDLQIVPQDEHLANNQSKNIKCGDNGIFKGCRVNEEEKKLTRIVRALYKKYTFDGKFIYDSETDTLIACQSNVDSDKLKEDLELTGIKNVIVNPLGYWTGGSDVDTGACNRKLGSDLGRAVTGGGLHFKDISKADVSVNIYLHKMAQLSGKTELPVKYAVCAIGDKDVVIDGVSKSYKEITKVALDYIKELGGFEKLAEWGLV
jgi:S-adenosylmethionine synthetase